MTHLSDTLEKLSASESGAPVWVCFSKRTFTKESIEEFAAKSLVAPATLVSDGLGCFNAVNGGPFVHERHVTGGGAACVKRSEFWAVNTILGNLKTAFNGTYHAFRFEKYADRYLAQVQYLFNRRFNLRTILTRLAGVACATKPYPRKPVFAAEVPCKSGAAMQGLQLSTLSLRQQVFQALRDLSNAAYFAGPESWTAVGYPGPLKV